MPENVGYPSKRRPPMRPEPSRRRPPASSVGPVFNRPRGTRPGAPVIPDMPGRPLLPGRPSTKPIGPAPIGDNPFKRALARRQRQPKQAPSSPIELRARAQALRSSVNL